MPPVGRGEYSFFKSIFSEELHDFFSWCHLNMRRNGSIAR